MHSTNLTTKLSSHYTKITGRFVFYLLLSATSLLLLSQCASPVPSHDDFEKFSQQYETIIEPDLRKLSRMLLEEEITEEEYHYQVAQLRNNSTKKINDLIYQNHELKQSTWASQGLPSSSKH